MSHMASHTLTFPVAVIGPADTENDAKTVKDVIRELSDEFSIQGISIKFHHWSELPPGLGKSAQEYIDGQISWSEMDFVVGMRVRKVEYPKIAAKKRSASE